MNFPLLPSCLRVPVLAGGLLSLLAGCVSTGGGEPRAGGRERVDLNLCLYYSRSAPGTRRVLDRPGLGVMIGLDDYFQSVKVVSGSDDARDCDLMAEVNDPTVFKQPYFEVYSARSKKYLMRAVTRNYANWRYGESLYAAFNKEAPLYAHLAAERAPAQAAAGGGVSKSDLQALIKEALKESAHAEVRGPERDSSLLAPPSLTAGEQAFGADDAAVVIGVEKYRGLPAAEYAAGDARLVKDYLLALGFKERNIQLLVDEDATQSAIRKFVGTWLPNRAKAGGRVVVYYSGHGSPDPATGAAYIVPHDGDPNYLADTGYALGDLYAKLGALPSGEVAVLLDACFSGAGGRSVLAKGARPMVVTQEQAVLAPKLVVLAAARGAQISTSSSEAGHGLFTYHLLKALKDGKKDIVEIYRHIQPLVEDGAKALNVEQTPSLTPDPLVAPIRFPFRN
jgi:hypothetical protein